MSDTNFIKDFNGVHSHFYSITAFCESTSKFSPEIQQLTSKFYHFNSSSNISLRKAVSECTTDFINSLIGYGFRIGKSGIPKLTSDYLWNIPSRNSLRNDLIKYSQKLCIERLEEFKNGYVHISVDSTTINHKSIVDIILICFKPSTEEKTLLLKEVILKKSTAKDYRNEIVSTISVLKEKDITVYSIVSDGLRSQTSAFDISRPSSFQNQEDSQDGTLNKVLYVSCRCHLLNLVFNDWIDLSPEAQRLHKEICDI